MSLSGPSSGGHDDDDAGAFVDINITPLTDVILVLLIIFMVTSTAVVEQERAKTQAEAQAAELDRREAEAKAREEQAKRKAANGALEVNLPAGAPGGAAPTADVVVRISDTGSFDLDGHGVADASVRGSLEALAKEHPAARLVVEADAKSPHGRVVWLMETAKDVGFADLAIATHAEGPLPLVP